MEKNKYGELTLRELSEKIGDIEAVKTSISNDVSNGSGVMTDEQFQQWDAAEAELAQLSTAYETKTRLLSAERRTEKAEIATAPRSFSAAPYAPRHSHNLKPEDEDQAFRAWLLTQTKNEHLVPQQWNESAKRMGLSLNREFPVQWGPQSKTVNADTINGEQLGGVLRRLQNMGGIMGLATVMQTSNAVPLRYNLRDTTAYKAVIAAELSTTVATQQTETSVTIGNFEWRSGIFEISNELIRDAAYDVIGDYMFSLVDSFRLGWGEALAQGAGTTEPKGVELCTTYATVDESVAEMDDDDLLGLYHSVDGDYRTSNKCAFVCNDAMALKIKRLRDTTGRQLWNSSTNSNIVVGQEGTLHGKALVVDNHVSDNVVLFGDFSRFRVRVVGSLRTQFLNELYALKNAVGIVGWAGMDSAIVDANALRKLVVTPAP